MNFPVGAMLGAVAIALLGALALGAVAVRLGFPIPDERRRSGTIDGLRGYLALLVMAQHFSIWSQMTRGMGWQAPPAIFLSNFGVLSVGLFFMITGFLFFGKVSGGFAATDWRRLYVSRAFRILPLQFVVVMIVSIVALAAQDFAVERGWISYPLRVAAWMTSQAFPDFFGFRDSALVTANVMWSLGYEWIFYVLVLPVLALLMSWRPVARRPLLIPAAMILSGPIVHWLHPAPIFIDSLIAFGFGIAVRIAVEQPWAGQFTTPFAGACALLLAALAFAVSTAPLGILTQSALGLFFLCVAAGNGFGGLTTNRGALVLGECSFGIYMLHGIVLFLSFRGAWPMLTALESWQVIALFPLLVACVVLAAMASFLLIEKPAVRLGHWVAKRGWKRPRGSVGGVENTAA